jgi:hypothetical protein
MGGWITGAKWYRYLGIEASIDADVETLKHAQGRPVAVMLLDPIKDNLQEAASVQDADKEDGGPVAVRQTNPERPRKRTRMLL